MNCRKTASKVYKIVRSVLFAAIALVTFLYIALYVVFSIPAVQNKAKAIAEQQLSALLGSRLTIGRLEVSPLNELVLDDVTLYTPGNEKCIGIERIGAGINLWELIAHGRILITYAELIGLDGRIWQQYKDSPLNIQFIIDAFAPKDKNKPPAKFRLDIRNIVIRKSAISYDKRYMQPVTETDRIDFNHLKISNLSADLILPLVSNDSIRADIRRLSLKLKDGPEIRNLSLKLKTDPHHITLRDFRLRMPGTDLRLSDIMLTFPSLKEIGKGITDLEPLKLGIAESYINPSDFKGFFPPLDQLDRRFDINADISISPSKASVSDLKITTPSGDFIIDVENLDATSLNGMSLRDKDALRYARIELGELNLILPQSSGNFLASAMPQNASPKLNLIRNAIGDLKLHLSGAADLNAGVGKLDIDLLTEIGTVTGIIEANLAGGKFRKGSVPVIKAGIDLKAIAKNLTAILPYSPVSDFTAEIEGTAGINTAALKRIKNDPSGALAAFLPKADVHIAVPSATFKGNRLQNIIADADFNSGNFNFSLISPSAPLDFALEAEGRLDRTETRATLNLTANSLRPGLLTGAPALAGSEITGDINCDIQGNTLDNLYAGIDIDNLRYSDPSHSREIHLENLTLTTEPGAAGRRTTILRSDWINGNIDSRLHPTDLVPGCRTLISGLLPTIAPYKANRKNPPSGDMTFSFTINRHTPWQQLGKLPAVPIYNVTIGGELDFDNSTARLAVDAPYLQQGKDKLIRSTRLNVNIADGQGLVDAFSIIPTKKGILDLGASILIRDDSADISLDFNGDKKGEFYGDLLMHAGCLPDLSVSGRKYTLRFLPSTLYLNGAEWNVGSSEIEYADKRILVDDFSISHGDQHITINGLASTFAEDTVVVDLKDINLDYIFDTLNINYVSFGGIATGKAIARGVFTSEPEIHTTGLFVKNLSYNNCVLGDGDMTGDFDLHKMRVGIGASVKEAGRHVADINGGIWLGRDSLAFSFDTDKVRINFLQPFMKAFSSEVSGRASGKGLLYGTFSDIDMTGRFFADSIAVKVDYTNVTYHGSDSVVLTPGLVKIPAFTLKDPYGNTATLRGELRHRYFHEPSFSFRVQDVKSMLVYNTDAKMNSVWYGRIFGSGSGFINGRPGLVEIIADMTTEKNSDFTFVLDDTMEAAEYSFLTFTDKRKALIEATETEELTEEDTIVAAFNKKIEAQQAGESDDFRMDIRATVTPDIKLILVMDPASGDKIVARGSGPMNITYSSDGDEMRMYGKYTLQEGKYNFTLQDLILKDFIIKPGSSVSFNGDPMEAILNIRAAYRVNTNLTDLDPSFATDKDLNRTNVPVDAMLIVTGDMTNPDISFDIELPTLNEEVARKVRSIISSEDMMSRQIIYLLALNRFYSPEYMGTQTNGGEWASVASSTLSSQIQNILGQLTDKFTIAPSLRSDKGDFSDVEVDVALSSRLFNNRLLINGNLGYRDPSNSSTTFVGDFDVEYLLTNKGNLRLKAYNHFNDQNYYLKSALTTQGIGLIYRLDFGDLLRPRKRKERK